MKDKGENLAKLASIYAGLVFGIYWIPLRALDDAGFPGLWAVVIFSGLSLVVLSPIALYRAALHFPGSWRFHSTGITIGLAFTLYAAAFNYTEVVRASLLFYLLPIWGFVLARLFLREMITPVRWLSITFGIIGMLILFGVDIGIPLPQNVGDWMALSAGILWAFGSLSMLTDHESGALDYGLAFFFWSTLTAGGLALLVQSLGGLEAAQWPELPGTLSWLFPIIVLIIIPGGFATIYGPTKLNPGVAGLLFMTEISVAAISAALLTDEPFGVRQLLGVTAVTLAGLTEPLWQVYRSYAPKQV